MVLYFSISTYEVDNLTVYAMNKARQQRRELAEKTAECVKLKAQLNARADDSQEVRRLMDDNILLRKQRLEMEKFLADYGVTDTYSDTTIVSDTLSRPGGVEGHFPAFDGLGYGATIHANWENHGGLPTHQVPFVSHICALNLQIPFRHHETL